MQRRARAELLLLGTTLIWGGTFVVVKEGLADSSPILMVAVRFGAAALLLLPFAWRALRRAPARAFGAGALLGLLLFGGFVTQTVGLRYTTSSKSAFITGMVVVLTPLFQVLFERRPPRLGNVLGVILVCGGLYLLTAPEGAELNRGDAYTLACAGCFALFIVALDVFSKRHGALLLTFLQVGVTGALAALAALAFEEIRFVATPSLGFSLGYLTVLATVLALLVQNREQHHTTPTRTAVIFSLEPVIAATLAWALRGETLGALGVAGGATIVVGVLVSQLSDVLFRPKAQPATKIPSSRSD